VGFSVDPVLGSAKGFAIEANRLAFEGVDNVAYPVGEEVLKAFGIKPCEEPPEGVVRGIPFGSSRNCLNQLILERPYSETWV